MWDTNHISKEHILLGIIGGDATGLAAKVLQSAGIDLGVSREQAEKLIGRGGGCSGLAFKDLRFTYDAKSVLDFSLKYAKYLGIKCYNLNLNPNLFFFLSLLSLFLNIKSSIFKTKSLSAHRENIFHFVF